MANSWKVDKAERRLRTHARWRKDYVHNGRIDEASVSACVKAPSPFPRQKHPLMHKSSADHCNLTPQSEVKDEIASGKVFIQGVDKAGRPCMYVIAAKHLTSERDVDQCKRFICYSLDRAIEHIDPERNPMGSITVIFDLRGGLLAG